MRAILAAIPIFAAVVSSARADWEYTKWGMTPEQVVSASKGAVTVLPAADRYKNEEDHWEIAAQGSHKDGSLNLSVGFTFDTKAGGLKCVMYNAEGQAAALLKGTMIRRYGPPQKESSLFGSQTLEWTTPDHIEFVMGQKAVAAVVTHCAP